MDNHNKKIPVSVKILNQNYDVFCEENEKNTLLKSAELLNDKMMKTKAEGKTIGLDRIAVISALNFASDSLNYKEMSNAINSTVKDKIQRLNLKLDNILKD